jgi:hypothetical protein
MDYRMQNYSDRKRYKKLWWLAVLGDSVRTKNVGGSVRIKIMVLGNIKHKKCDNRQS